MSEKVMTMSNLNQPDASLVKRAKTLHKRVPLIDGHNDLPWQYRKRVNRALSKIDIAESQQELHTDIVRLREGGLGGQFWSVYVPNELEPGEFVRATIEQIDVVYNMLRRYPDTFELTRTADQLERGFQSGKIVSLIGMEGGHSIDNSIAALRMFYRLGARYKTLTHDLNVGWADSCTDAPKANGLTDFGREVVREMNRIGMLVDLSHASPDTMRDALDVVEAPVIFSHSSALGLVDHRRNVPDGVVKGVAENDGVVMASFVPGFTSQHVVEHAQRRDAERVRLEEPPGSTARSVKDGLTRWDEENPAPRATLSQVADHVDHIRDVTGIDHVGVGSDFDGSSVPQGLEDVSMCPMLTAELIRREYSDEEILKILGLNVLRVMRQAEAVAERLQAERGPSEALIEELDGPGHCVE